MIKRILVIAALAVSAVSAHCDALDGPVVEAARRALSTGDVSAVLPWVQSAQESAVREAFLRTLSVRKLNSAAETLADTWFFETVVRIHRAAEGAPYTGLRPAGGHVPPAVRAADKAIAAGDLKPLQAELASGLQGGLQERFQRVLEAKKHSGVEAGRRYVAAYVDFIHFAERMEKAMGVEPHQH